MDRKTLFKNSLRAALGLIVFTLGDYMAIEANIGLSPWDCLSLGLAGQTGLSRGQATIAISLTVLAFDLLMKERIGIGTLLDTVPPCKHCGEPLTRQANGNHTHAAGLQAGKGRCALSPYGFMAEPIGTPCGDHPANPCNGSRGIEPKP